MIPPQQDEEIAYPHEGDPEHKDYTLSVLIPNKVNGQTQGWCWRHIKIKLPHVFKQQFSTTRSFPGLGISYVFDASEEPSGLDPVEAAKARAHEDIAIAAAQDKKIYTRLIDVPKRVLEVAGRLYETYCVAVGGRAFNGDKLPDWDTFVKDLDKEKQALAWCEVGWEALQNR